MNIEIDINALTEIHNYSYFDSFILILDPYLSSIEYLIYSYGELIDESVSNKN